MEKMIDESEVKNIDREIRNHLQKQNEIEKITTKEFAEKLSGEGFGSESYIKARLHIQREWFPEQVEGLKTYKEDDETGGEDTRYWRKVRGGDQ